MPKIVPSILVPTFAKFTAQARRLEGLTDIAQIDVMDGKFVANKSFDEIEKINELSLKLNWELHLMVAHPLAELEKWDKVKNIQRVIFHAESQDDPKQTIANIRNRGWEAGMALNPKTSLTATEPYLDLVDVVLFMTVIPGKQGGKFLPEVGEKIKQLKTKPNAPLIAVDGGVNESNIALIKSWGVNIIGVGSALSQAPDAKHAFKKLTNLLN